MQDVKDFLFGQILDDFLASGDREAAIEHMRALSTMHNQKVVGVMYQAKEGNRLPGDKGPRITISSLDTERRFAAQEDKGEGRLEHWEKVGLAYGGPDQTLPTDMVYMDGGLVVNCSDELTFGHNVDPERPSIFFGSEENPHLVTLAFESKENLEQVITALVDLSENMEPTPCLVFTDE